MKQKLSKDIQSSIDQKLEDIYKDASDAGKLMHQQNLKRSQIRGLETVALSSRRFSEILNYIKNQAGKDKGQQWPTVARTLLHQLGDLEKRAHEIAGEDPGLTLDIKLKLARGWVKQVVAHYLFAPHQKEA